MAEEADRPVTLSDLLGLETRLATSLEERLSTSLTKSLTTNLETSLEARLTKSLTTSLTTSLETSLTKSLTKSLTTSLEERLSTSLATSLEATLTTRLETKMDAHHAETRRHFDMVAEQMRADFKVVIDKTDATGKKVDRLIANNAIEHAAFVDAIADHEVRQRVLERMHDTDPSA